MNKKNTCAIIVTFNRLELLKECLGAIRDQTLPVNHVVVINNASTDGTKDYLDNIKSDKLIIKHSLKNEGGAGGFSSGIKTAYLETDDDYFWIMDDDTIVGTDCNKALLDKANLLENKFGFLISNVRWTDNSSANVMMPSENWPEKISDGLVKVDYGSFVSFLVSRENVSEVGLPIREFFIWGDDAEYSLRLRTINDGYFVTDAMAVHKSKTNQIAVGVVSDSEERISRYFYYYRNELYNYKRYFKNQYFKVFMINLVKILIIGVKAKDHKIKRVKIAFKGIMSSLNFNPKIEKV